MLPRKQRIPSFALAGVMRQGRRYIDTRFQLFVLQNTHALSRFSFVVPAKIDKRATRRNRIRRLLNQSVQNIYLSVAQGWDCVVLIKQNISDMKQVEVEKLVSSMLQKAGILHI